MALKYSPAADRDAGRLKAKRIAVADIKPKSFDSFQWVQGTVSMCEPFHQESQERFFVLRDITFSSSNAMAAAGLDSKVIEDSREQRTKRRKSEAPEIHSIQVLLRNGFLPIDVSKGDIVTIRGKGVKVEHAGSELRSDHMYKIILDGVDTNCEILAADKSSARGGNEATVFAKTNVVYLLDGLHVLSSTSKKVTKQSDDKLEYVSLGNLRSGTDHQNVYGILANMVFPMKTSYQSYRVSLLLCDEDPASVAYPIEACAFPEPDNLLEFLPAMSCFGTVVRFHRVKVTEFNKKPSIQLVNRVSTMSIASMIPGDREVRHLVLKNAVSKHDMDWARVEQLRKFGAELLRTQERPEFLYNQYLRTLTGAMHAPVYEAPVVDVLVKVCEIPPAIPDDVSSAVILEFAVTDGRTKATVRYAPDVLQERNEFEQYWELVRRFVGTEVGVWIKIRDCQVIRNTQTLLAQSGAAGGKGTRPTTFFRVPEQFCKPQSAPQIAPSLNAKKQIFSRVQGASAGLPFTSIANIITNQNGPPYRVNAKVTGVFPNDVAMLCKSKGQGVYVWAVALQLQDTTGRLDALITGDEAKDFFRMQPTDLSTNIETRNLVAVAIDTLLSESTWLDCMLVPLSPDRKVFSIVDTVLLV